MNLVNNQHLVARYKKQINSKYPIAADELEWRIFSPGECLYEQGYPLPFLCFLVK